MKKIVIILSVFLVSCAETVIKNKADLNIEFYKFFDPFSFKGVQKIDSTSKDFPLYKIYYDSLKNIVKINEYISESQFILSVVKHSGNVKIMLDSSDGAFEHEVVKLYRFFYDQKVISIYNHHYKNTNQKYTKVLSIYTPNRALEYIFFGDGLIDRPELDSTYLKKITYLDPNSVLGNNLNLNEDLIEEKSIREISNTKSEIIVKTLYTNRDTTVNQTFNYCNKKYDNFWVAKYNFLDSIASKLYFDKYYKN